ncbi:unnamed protein product, partial [Rotaria sp. Silwood1]
MIENQFKIEVKDDINNEQSTGLLIEPIVAVHSDKPVPVSPTVATRFLGIFYTLLSTCIFTISVFITKELKAFFSTTGLYAYYFAYRYLILPDLITIRFTQIIWTAIITSILYREKPSISMIISILLTTIGVIFVAQPSFLFNKISNKN